MAAFPGPLVLVFVAGARPQAPKLAAAQVLRFARDGHTCTRGLLSAAEARRALGAAQIHFKAREAEALVKVAADHGSDGVDAPFHQLFNCWRVCAALRALGGSPALARTAAQLLGARRVRLYQDTLLVKRRHHGDTGWHSDLRMCPIDTNDLVTAWVALTAVPAGGSALHFASTSHRDMANLFWAESPLAPVQGSRYKTAHYAPLAPGDVTWHHGWTLHAAPAPAPGEGDRWALAFTYFADGARVLGRAARKRRLHGEDAPSYRDWLGDLSGGRPARHALLPLVPFDAAPDRPA